MENYIVVLFKNKTKKKIIKKFITFNRAKLFYDNLIKESQEVIFNVEIESGEECKYELGLIEMSGKQLVPVYMTDEFGRNVKVKLDEDGMTLFQIAPYKKEELIYDVKESKKITVQELIKKYLKGDGMKMVSVLNNKVVVQQEEKFNLFTLKNEQESSRFVDCLSLYFFKIKRGDCLFVKDYSSAQRKYLYGILESNGFSKSILYRKFTSLPQLK
jgi:predicted Fe-Mo cluster-binding NifX family protein